MSRLSREIPKDSLELLLRIFKSGLTIAFTEYGGKVIDGQGNDPAWFQILGGMMQASIEWQTKQERIVGGFDVVQENLENGKLDHFKGREKGTKHGLYSFWLNFDEKRKQFIVLEEEAEIVRKIQAETLTKLFGKEAVKGVTKAAKSVVKTVTSVFSRVICSEFYKQNLIYLFSKKHLQFHLFLEHHIRFLLL